MQPLKSIDLYGRLFINLHTDIAHCFNVARSELELEHRKVLRRLKTEGFSFFTKTLPSLAKAVDKALATGTRLSTPGFKHPKGSAIPHFLGWLLSQLFDSDGVELAHADSEALKHLRQLCYLMYKLQIPHAPKTIKTVLEGFVATDAALSNFDDACYTDPIIPKARQIICSVMANIDPHDVLPRHGPGSVATGETTVEKRNFSRIYSTLEKEYPFTEYFHYSASHTCDTYRDMQRLEVIEYPTAKVVLVPKDSRGPRLISSEPLEIQWIQQGLGRNIEARIESHWLTAGYVNFTDQSVNQRLALEGSRDGKWVTLDMKDASDRVSNSLVKSLFSLCPTLLAAMQACRSTHTRLPNGEVIALNKFAPMGSRLCFPVEALIFYALILSTLHLSTKLPLRKLRGRVFVYGDDIIMRQEDYLAALQSLPRVGLMFNPNKCCVAGFFRESCGVDAYKGVIVTPTRLGTAWCYRRKKSEVLASYVALRNALRGRYYFGAATVVESALRSVYGNIPYTDKFCRLRFGNGAYITFAAGPAYAADSVLIKESNAKFRKRVNSYGYLEVYSYVSQPLKVRAPKDDWAELLRRFSDGWPFSANLLGTSGDFYAIPRRNCLKRGWMAV